MRDVFALTIPVLDEILRIEVIDEKRIPELGVFHSFVQRES